MADRFSTAGPDEARMSTADIAETMNEHGRHPSLPEEPNEPPLLPEAEVAELRMRWDQVQTGFVDEPRRSVENADALVAEAMRRLAEIFAAERAQLESQWDRGDDVSTEDLRVALQRYRSFFGRLLMI